MKMRITAATTTKLQQVLFNILLHLDVFVYIAIDLVGNNRNQLKDHTSRDEFNQSRSRNIKNVRRL